MANLAELTLDLEEFETLLRSSKRLRTQGLLTTEIDRLKQEISKLKAKEAAANGASKDQKQGYQENITKYAWDQSDKFMKLYLYLDTLSSITEDNITTEFTNKSVTVKVQFAHKCSILHIARLCEEISPKESKVKKKPDYILVMLSKAEIGKTWAWVTEKEKKAKEAKDGTKPKPDASEDPSAGLTSMLKNMYDDGDDEMKRSISKAFYESQHKQQEGGAGGAGGDPMGMMNMNL